MYRVFADDVEAETLRRGRVRRERDDAPRKTRAGVDVETKRTRATLGDLRRPSRRTLVIVIALEKVVAFFVVVVVASAVPEESLEGGSYVGFSLASLGARDPRRADLSVRRSGLRIRLDALEDVLEESPLLGLDAAVQLREHPGGEPPRELGDASAARGRELRERDVMVPRQRRALRGKAAARRKRRRRGGLRV